MECRRKNNLKDDDETHLASDSATKDHKCALACVLTVSEMVWLTQFSFALDSSSTSLSFR